MSLSVNRVGCGRHPAANRSQSRPQLEAPRPPTPRPSVRQLHRGSQESVVRRSPPPPPPRPDRAVYNDGKTSQRSLRQSSHSRLLTGTKPRSRSGDSRGQAGEEAELTLEQLSGRGGGTIRSHSSPSEHSFYSR